jgi:hypothetical protein
VTPWVTLLIAGVLATPAGADTTLRERIVTFSVLSYDDPLLPIYEGSGQTVMVGDGVEFGLNPGYPQNGVDVVPVQVDIGPARVEVQFRTPLGYLLDATFNGYVLAFATECALFKGVRVDTAFTNMAITDADVTVQGGTLMVNVAGLPFTSQSRFAIDLEVADCPLS